ncbi:uncharacterized protein LOC143861192 [Tasmannia lanceolata]|uniref:uncharacterized protein LOC143861192 n=1 Tax=Tasmannia lanceolata TaxID=3420 RepID=UPI004062AD78
MRARVSKLVFSSLSDSAETNLLHNAPTMPLFHHLFPPHFSTAHFSTIPNRPLRGDKRDNQFQAPFTQNLNLGESDDDETTKKTHQNPSSPFPNRPMRGERKPNQSDDLFTRDLKNFSDAENTRKPYQNFPNQLSNKPIRGDKRDDKETHQSGSSQNPETESEPSLQDADEIFKKMKETGLIPNAVAMLDGLCKDGLIQEAMKLFGLMREKGTIPEVVIYTAVVEGFCKALKVDDAKRIFRKMQNNGISPNAFSYTVLIHGLCEGKKLEDAVDFCVEMLDAGHSPNVATFVRLVDGFCREKGVEEAESVIRRLKEKGFAVDDKAVREHLGKKGPFPPSVWEVIFGKKSSERAF